jgi:AcrR family transcriptional regulator
MRGQSSVEDPKAHVLAVASRLFYSEGIRAVGIERVQQEAGVARATIYRHFPGKDALALAFVELRDEQWRAWFRERVEALSPDVEGRPLAAFDAIAERIGAVGFRGCAFANTVAEYPNPGHPAHAAARRHKRLVVGYLAELCAAAALVDAPAVASQLMLLIDGAVAGAARENDVQPARTARSAARLLIEAASLPRHAPI